MSRRRAPIRAFAAGAAAIALAQAAWQLPLAQASEVTAPDDPGRILTAGQADALGAPDGVAASLVGLAVTPTGKGYWALAADGKVFAFGDADSFEGVAPTGFRLVDIAARPQGDGYWVTAADGGVFAFGGAGFLGSLGAMKLNSPVTAMTATPSGKGYWLVAADGGVFAFGDAHFYGSMGGTPLNAPVAAMAATPSGKGYWMVGGDGGVFAFGDAQGLGRFWASGTVTDLAARPDGDGYWAVVADPLPVFLASAASADWQLGEPGDAEFDRVAACESGGRWDLRTGNGYYGGLQFALGTWRALGGLGYPHQQSREAQIEIARRQWRISGWKAWPVCGRLPGLTQP